MTTTSCPNLASGRGLTTSAVTPIARASCSPSLTASSPLPCPLHNALPCRSFRPELSVLYFYMTLDSLRKLSLCVQLYCPVNVTIWSPIEVSDIWITFFFCTVVWRV